MRRRDVLSLGVAGMGLLAGCSTEPAAQGDGQREPTDTRRTDPDTIVVNPEGSDENAGTPDAPLATIQRAVELAEPGETVYVDSGRYFESVSTERAGTRNDPITITGPPDAVISGHLNDGWSVAMTIRHSHVHLTGVTLDGLQDPARPDDPRSYMNMAVNVIPHTQQYLTDLVIKPSAIGNTRDAMIKLNFVENAEVGEFRVIGPAGLEYLLRDRGGDFGEIIYIGSWAGSEFNVLERTGPLAGDDTSNDIHIHHIDNSLGFHHAEFVDCKLGTHDILVEYCTVAGGGQVGGYGRTIALQSYDTTIRWCNFRGGRHHCIDVGIEEVVRRREANPEAEWTEADRRAGTDNELYGNRINGFDRKAFYFQQADHGQGPDDQRRFCGNDYSGETDGEPDRPCDPSVTDGDGIGHLGGDSPWAG